MSAADATPMPAIALIASAAAISFERPIIISSEIPAQYSESSIPEGISIPRFQPLHARTGCHTMNFGHCCRNTAGQAKPSPGTKKQRVPAAPAALRIDI
jgi:hypothetical protein